MGVCTERQHETNESQFHRNCNLRLAIFACWCCVASLLLHTHSYIQNDGVETVLDEKARQILIQEVDEEIEINIQKYFKYVEFKNRTKRDVFDKPGEEEDMIESYVEFYNSTLRWERQKEEFDKWAQGEKGTDVGGDFKVFLTDNSGIAIEVLMNFCAATQEYCPPGAQGPVGPVGYPGSPGDRGISGLSGAPGNRGRRGFSGYSGLKGSSGGIGAKGSFGIRGRVGPVGARGVKGETGDAGVKGASGDAGLSGPEGPAGPKGDLGFYRRARIHGRNF